MLPSRGPAAPSSWKAPSAWWPWWSLAEWALSRQRSSGPSGLSAFPRWPRTTPCSGFSRRAWGSLRSSSISLVGSIRSATTCETRFWHGPIAASARSLPASRLLKRLRRSNQPPRTAGCRRTLTRCLEPPCCLRRHHGGRPRQPGRGERADRGPDREQWSRQVDAHERDRWLRHRLGLGTPR